MKLSTAILILWKVATIAGVLGYLCGWWQGPPWHGSPY